MGRICVLGCISIIHVYSIMQWIPCERIVIHTRYYNDLHASKTYTIHWCIRLSFSYYDLYFAHLNTFMRKTSNYSCNIITSGCSTTCSFCFDNSSQLAKVVTTLFKTKLYLDWGDTVVQQFVAVRPVQIYPAIWCIVELLICL